jgi:hypothetical protein
MTRVDDDAERLRATRTKEERRFRVLRLPHCA